MDHAKRSIKDALNYMHIIRDLLDDEKIDKWHLGLEHEDEPAPSVFGSDCDWKVVYPLIQPKRLTLTIDYKLRPWGDIRKEAEEARTMKGKPEKKDIPKRCETCRWAEHVDEYMPNPYSIMLEHYECRIRAPTYKGGFPITERDGWCGEWEAKEGANE
jgi:hypothetical protein